MSLRSAPMRASPGTTGAFGWYRGWNIVAVCVLSQVAGNGLAINAFSLFLHDWAVDLHTPISSLQLGVSACGLVSSLFAPFVGGLVDKYSIRWIMAAGLLCIALFDAGISFATIAWQIQLLYAIPFSLGLAFATSLPANAIVSRWFVHRRGLALGLNAFGIGIAGAILPPIITMVLPVAGWRMVWRFAGVAIIVVVIPLALLILRDRPTERDGRRYLTDDGTAGVQHGLSGRSDLDWRDVFKHRNFWLLLVVYLPMLALWGGCAHNLAPIAASQGLSQHAAGILLSALSLSHVGSTLIMGLLVDRFGTRLPLFGLALAASVGGAMVAFGRGPVTLGVAVVFVGLSGGLWPLLAAAIAADFGTKGFGRAFGLLLMFVPVIVLTPFAVAKIQEATGTYVIGLMGLAALTCMGAVACLFMREGGRERPSPAGTT